MRFSKKKRRTPFSHFIWGLPRHRFKPGRTLRLCSFFKYESVRKIRSPKKKHFPPFIDGELYRIECVELIPAAEPSASLNKSFLSRLLLPTRKPQPALASGNDCGHRNSPIRPRKCLKRCWHSFQKSSQISNFEHLEKKPASGEKNRKSLSLITGRSNNSRWLGFSAGEEER